MRLWAFFALLLIAHVCSAEDGLLNFQDQVLEKINSLTEKVDIILQHFQIQGTKNSFIYPRFKSYFDFPVFLLFTNIVEHQYQNKIYAAY